MPKYNIFENHIDEGIRVKHVELMAQTKVLFDASNLISDAMNSLNMSQKDLSKLLSISKGYSSRLLSGTENLSLKNFAKILHQLGYELNLSIKEIKSYNDDNVIWADFGESNSPIQIKSSLSESDSPWSETSYSKAM